MSIPELTSCLLAPPPVQMGLGVASCVGLGVGIPVFALNLQFWKAKGGK